MLGESTLIINKNRESVLVADHEIVREFWDKKVHVQVSWIE
jgi:hypothetical protein